MALNSDAKVLNCNFSSIFLLLPLHGTGLVCDKLKFHDSSFPRTILVTSSRGYHEDVTRKTVPWNLSYSELDFLLVSVSSSVKLVIINHYSF